MVTVGVGLANVMVGIVLAVVVVWRRRDEDSCAGGSGRVGWVRGDGGGREQLWWWLW